MAAAREKIKRAKENDLTYTILGVVGVVAAIAIPFIMRFVLGFSMDTFSWLLTAVGILFFIGGYLGTWYNGRKVKGLIEQMEKGPGKADTGDDAR
jgi:cation transport ATPase